MPYSARECHVSNAAWMAFNRMFFILTSISCLSVGCRVACLQPAGNIQSSASTLKFWARAGSYPFSRHMRPHQQKDVALLHIHPCILQHTRHPTVVIINLATGQLPSWHPVDDMYSSKNAFVPLASGRHYIWPAQGGSPLLALPALFRNLEHNSMPRHEIPIVCMP